MSVYKALAAAVVSRGEVEMPDGKTYTVSALSMGDLIAMEALQSEEKSDAVTLPALVGIAARVTGAPRTSIEALSPDALGYVIAIARHGLDAVLKTLSDEASASGNSPASSAEKHPRRSTSRNKR